MAEGNEYFVPRDVTKVDFLGQTYQLSWTPPRAAASRVQSYTVFWCLAKNGRERPYQVREIFNIEKSKIGSMDLAPMDQDFFLYV